MLISGLTQRPLFCLPAGDVPFYAYHGGKNLKSSYLETTLFFSNGLSGRRKNSRQNVKVSF
jgi:hypothetical protein